MKEPSVAFADESIRVSANPPMYLIVATIVPSNADLKPLEAMLPKGAAKLHWRDLGSRAQKASLGCISKLETESTLVIAAPIIPQKQERARRKNLETLMPLLEARGIDRLVMESRFPSADAKDAALFRSMRKKGVISAIGMDFANPEEEHRLWIPDQILGAYGETLLGSQSSAIWADEWKSIAENVTVVEIKL